MCKIYERACASVCLFARRETPLIPYQPIVCFDTWLWSTERSALWLNTRPLPHKPLRGHEKHHCTSKQPTHSLPHHPTWHMWDSADHNNGSAPLMLKCLSVYLHRAACPSAVCGALASLKSSGRHIEGRRPYWQHLLLETHGQNQTQLRESVWPQWRRRMSRQLQCVALQSSA